MENQPINNTVVWRVIVAFAVFGVLWRIFLDPLVALCARDWLQLASLQAYKEWLFIPASGLLLYLLLLRGAQNRGERARTAPARSSAGGGSVPLRADDHYRDLVENSSDLIGTHDLEGTILSANAAAVRLVGCRSPEDLVGRKVSDFLGANVRHLFDSYLETLRRDGRAQGIVKVRVEAGERILQYDNSLRDGDVVRPVVRCFGRDVTEQKRVEARLRQAQKMEALGRFASGIIHDFNSVLTAISGYCQMALKSITPDSPLYVPLEEIKKAEERATELTRQLLAFGRMQEIQFEPLDLNGVAGGMEKLIRHLLGTQIELVASLHPDIGRINAHRGQLEQVITNLVTNAVHAMPQGGRLTLETHNVRLEQVREFDNEEVPAGSYVVLSVSDTGAGMSYEVRTRIFEPFFTTRPPGKGTGLGLSIVYGIVKQSGAYIGVESQPGHGARFRIFFPRL